MVSLEVETSECYVLTFELISPKWIVSPSLYFISGLKQSSGAFGLKVHRRLLAESEVDIVAVLWCVQLVRTFSSRSWYPADKEQPFDRWGIMIWTVSVFDYLKVYFRY